MVQCRGPGHQRSARRSKAEVCHTRDGNCKGFDWVWRRSPQMSTENRQTSWRCVAPASHAPEQAAKRKLGVRRPWWHQDPQDFQEGNTHLPKHKLKPPHRICQTSDLPCLLWLCCHLSTMENLKAKLRTSAEPGPAVCVWPAILFQEAGSPRKSNPLGEDTERLNPKTDQSSSRDR